MDMLTFLQHYWWFLISLLGALLVFLLFVQGGQGLLYIVGRTDAERDLIVNALGRKWELTFTTLVTFGGAFYVWMAILLVFVIQAVSYEYRRKPANLLGRRTYEAFLVINGIAGPLLLGVAVGTFYTGAMFTVNRMNMASIGGDTAISQWTTAWHGLEALGNPLNLLLGVAVFALSRLLALHFFLNNLADETLHERSRRLSGYYALLFLLCFLPFFGGLLATDGRTCDPLSGVIAIEPYKYLHNLLEMPVVSIILLCSVAALLFAIWIGWRRGSRRAIWFSGAGTIGAVLALLLLAGWNNTCYYPSLADLQSSLSISNSSSSLFTLKAMSIVSLLIPFVAAYIWYAWRALTKPLSEQEVEKSEHKY